ncbi:F0F1 ATP synthase subunit A [Rubrobacter calidifluminis]|uniref:F0F1 ATP synthase subunit A n=1 Tax=Rubrobacter calidifluminis TaxID=1392640 RepID=UPI00235EEE34|nr:F0F1 ATP synthase subunit A [Rubrobacter calidifluminis]
MTVTLALLKLSQEQVREKILHTWASGEKSWVIPIHLGPLNLSITKIEWFLFIGVAVTFLFLFFGSRALKNRPGAYQVLVEETYGFGRRMLGGQIGPEGMKWFPYTLSIFVLLLVLNLIALIPNTYPVTSNLSFTGALAILTFILTQYEGVRRHGLGEYLKSWVPEGSGRLMAPALWFLHLIQEFTKPLTLAMRLYANIIAGHLIIFVFLSFILYYGIYFAVVSVPLAVVFYAFEIFVAVIQAYIFAILTQVYIELAIYGEG